MRHLVLLLVTILAGCVTERESNERELNKDRAIAEEARRQRSDAMDRDYEDRRREAPAERADEIRKTKEYTEFLEEFARRNGTTPEDLTAREQARADREYRNEE